MAQNYGVISMFHNTLAFYMPYGNEDAIKEYSKEELKDPAIVKQVFDYCQILEGNITYSGWLFLLKQYGYDRLYDIDQESGWFDSASLEEFKQDVDLEIRMVKASEFDTCVKTGSS